MQRLAFVIERGILIINDLETNGSLRIKFKPFNKPDISPAFEAMNDLEHAINVGELDLKLYGISTLLERRGFNLRGDVTLKSSHLHDPKITNSSLSYVSLIPRATIINSHIEHIGYSHFGELTFNECSFKANPKQRPYASHAVYFNNILV
ncbi:putative pentapeptide repeat protein [Kosakonia phage Kc263]|uniref:Pentapeptide repeat protein n=1 Tax=Kosakonia phage Kc263 TaxID=2863194 RepID=A0AAE8BGJ9_9CAUD|nr:putative pentapeptide repeat protein [Kosakonia phage Kc263]QYN80047.1 putative pentapeptide repeat protein [Kosakonia phage Kc263]